MNTTVLGGRGLAAVGIAVLAVAVGAIGVADAADGGNLLLGRLNTATHMTTLKDATGTPLALRADKAKPPLVVNSTVLVKHLNAAKVGGLSAAQLGGSGSAAGFGFNLSKLTKTKSVPLPKAKKIKQGYQVSPVGVVSTAKLGRGSYIVTGTEFGQDALCWLGTTPQPNKAHQLGLSGEGSAAETMAFTLSGAARISEYCATTSTTERGAVLSAGISAVHVGEYAGGTITKPTVSTQASRHRP